MNEKTIQYGVLQLKTEARVNVLRGKRTEIVTVGDKTRHPHAKFICRCVTCKQDFEDEKALIAGHPPTKEMIANEQVHVWAYFSADPSEEPELVPEGANKDERRAIEARNAAIPQIGLVSDDNAWS